VFGGRSGDGREHANPWGHYAAAAVVPSSIAPERLVFIDESAGLTSMAPRHGRGPRGQRSSAKVPFGNWKRLSVLSALGIEGVLATMSVEAATDGDTFAARLEQVLLPVLRERKPDVVLVMDNLCPHKTPGA
jgi:hypothetical protein